MKVVIYHQSSDHPQVFEGDEDQIREALNKEFDWLHVTPSEPLDEVIEDLNSYQVYEAFLDKSDLKKGLGNMARGVAMAGAVLAGGSQAQNPSPKLTQAIERVATPPAPVKWSPGGLHHTVIPIAHLESSFGQNTNHPAGSSDYDTAYGALGFKPMTAHEEYNASPTLKQLYGEFKDPAEFTAKFKADPKFYNLLASSHFLRLTNKHGSPERAAYGWRHGSAAAAAASPEQIAKDIYVQKYKALALGTGLQKMAIRDLKPGTPSTKPAIEDLPDEPGEVYHDYTHLISPALRGQYKLHVSHNPQANRHADVILTHGNEEAGTIKGVVIRNSEGRKAINPWTADIDPNHRGKGLGRAMYEALYAHALHHMGIRNVAGDTHSSMAHKVHQALAEKHGLEYNATRINKEQGPYDDAYSDYEYALKSEAALEKMAIRDVKQGVRVDPESLPFGQKIQLSPGEEMYDYSHLLPQSETAPGEYQLHVHHTPTGAMVTSLKHHGKQVGQIQGVVARDLQGPRADGKYYDPGFTELGSMHHGKGLGKAMYEASFAHAYHKMGARAVAGGVHSTMASRVHASLAAKHGLKYVPQPNTSYRHKWQKQDPNGSFDDAFAQYRYALKSEGELAKAISTIPPGKHVPGDETDVVTHDYSHLVPKEHPGYRILINSDVRASRQGNRFHTVQLLHNDRRVGGIQGETFNDYQPHSDEQIQSVDPGLAEIQPAHRNKGLGIAMYEALYAHAQRFHGAKQVSGSTHSTMASRVHRALARKHGLDYQPRPRPHSVGGEPGEDPHYMDNAFGNYKYAIKSEFKKKVLDPNMGVTMQHEDHDLGGGDMLTHVKALHPNGQVIGETLMEHHPNGTIVPMGVSVHEGHRRLGIASAMYEHAQKVTGKTVVPSNSQTPLGQALWQGNQKAPQFGKPNLGV